MRLVLYSKPGCHLCEHVKTELARYDVDLEERDITTNSDWAARFQYLIPVLESPDGRCLEAPIDRQAIERFFGLPVSLSHRVGE